MKLSLSIDDIKRSYNGLKRLAQKSFKNGDLSRAIFYIYHCSVIAQQFNWIYADDEIEQLLKQIGNRIITSDIVDYESNPKRVVFLDDFCTSFVLTIQYVDALLVVEKFCILQHDQKIVVSIKILYPYWKKKKMYKLSEFL